MRNSELGLGLPLRVLPVGYVGQQIDRAERPKNRCKDSDRRIDARIRKDAQGSVGQVSTLVPSGWRLGTKIISLNWVSSALIEDDE